MMHAVDSRGLDFSILRNEPLIVCGAPSLSRFLRQGVGLLTFTDFGNCSSKPRSESGGTGRFTISRL